MTAKPIRIKRRSKSSKTKDEIKKKEVEEIKSKPYANPFDGRVRDVTGNVNLNGIDILGQNGADEFLQSLIPD